MPGPEFRDKKELVLGEKKQGSWVTVSLVVVIMILAGTAYWIIQAQTAQKIPMTDLSPAVENGKIVIPLQAVLDKRLIRFEHEADGRRMPLLSYITEKGLVVTAVSQCKSCRSTRFHIDGQTLVCNSCETAWDLETLKGVGGKSLNYPPEIIESKVDQCCIKIDEKIIAQWKPDV